MDQNKDKPIDPNEEPAVNVSSDNPTVINGDSIPQAPNKFSFIKDIWQHMQIDKELQNPNPPESQNPGPSQSQEKENKIQDVIILGENFVEEESIEKKVNQLIWLTYRTGFEPIPKFPNGPFPLQFITSMVFNKNPLSTNFHSFIDNDNFTTDVGWGCMIRTSQSLLANSFNKLIKDPKKIVTYFRDDSESSFSLHNFIKVAGESPLQVMPGQWFGPNAASLSIQRLCNSSNSDELNSLPQMNVLISEGDLYEDQLNQYNGNLLILLPIRLGIDKTNKFYYESIYQLLNLPYSVGIAGGRPSSSFYFFGYDKITNELLYLDPHYPQSSRDSSPAIDDAEVQGKSIDSYHTINYQRLKIEELDPSMMIGLLFNNSSDLKQFKSICKDNKIIHFHSTSSKVEDIDFDIDIDIEDDDDDFENNKGDDFIEVNNTIENEESVKVEGQNIESEEPVKIEGESIEKEEPVNIEKPIREESVNIEEPVKEELVNTDP